LAFKWVNSCCYYTVNEAALKKYKISAGELRGLFEVGGLYKFANPVDP
jgi:hypothetical protein